MRRWIMLGRILLCTMLTCVPGVSQEPYEARAARLQPDDIPPLIEKARNGDLGSQILLWLAYARGHGVPKDVQRGVPWLRKAAEQGNIECEWVLSNMYDSGKGGLPVDQAEAFNWALKAAQGGHMVAQHNVGSAYRVGAGVETNLESAPEERAYALLLTRNLENPLSLDASAARAWLGTWWDEIPDVVVHPCNLVDAPNHEPYEYENQLYDQITFSEGVFILENPVKSTDWNAAFLAGISGALRAYESILKQKPSAKSAFLDDLRQQQDNGQLAKTMDRLVQQRCK